MISLARLQRFLPWNSKGYTAAFDADSRPHRDLDHAVKHIFKAAGKLMGLIEAADHSEPDWDRHGPSIGKWLADVVICATRAASRTPGSGELILELAVARRVAEVNDGFDITDPEARSEMWASGALRRIIDERLKQLDKGYDAAHDDIHSEGELAWAASSVLDGLLGIQVDDDDRQDWIDEFKREYRDADNEKTIEGLTVVAALCWAEIERRQRCGR